MLQFPTVKEIIPQEPWTDEEIIRAVRTPGIFTEFERPFHQWVHRCPVTALVAVVGKPMNPATRKRIETLAEGVGMGACFESRDCTSYGADYLSLWPARSA